jgi:hyperosmotically inducible periplasmic protein
MYRSSSNRAIILALAFMVTLSMFVAACGKSVGETVDDAGITAQVKTALLNDPDVGGLRIDVDTSQGLVTLSGIVKSKAEADKAVAIARKVDGVRDVKSTLQVNPAS